MKKRQIPRHCACCLQLALAWGIILNQTSIIRDCFLAPQLLSLVKERLKFAQFLYCSHERLRVFCQRILGKSVALIIYMESFWINFSNISEEGFQLLLRNVVPIANKSFSYCLYFSLQIIHFYSYYRGNFVAYKKNYTLRQMIDDKGPPPSNLHLSYKPITITSPGNLFHIFLLFGIQRLQNCLIKSVSFGRRDPFANFELPKLIEQEKIYHFQRNRSYLLILKTVEYPQGC